MCDEARNGADRYFVSQALKGSIGTMKDALKPASKKTTTEKPTTPPPATLADTFDPSEWLGALSLGGISATIAPAPKPDTFDPTEWLGALSLGGISAALTPSVPSNVILATSPPSALAAPRSPPTALAKPSAVKGYFSSERNQELALLSWPGLESEPDTGLGSGPEFFAALGIPAPSGVVPFEPKESTMIAIANALLDSAKMEVQGTGNRRGLPGRDGKAWVELIGTSRLAARKEQPKGGVQFAPGAPIIPRASKTLPEQDVVGKLKEQLARLTWALHTARTGMMRRIGELEDELGAVEGKSGEEIARLGGLLREKEEELRIVREQLADQVETVEGMAAEHHALGMEREELEGQNQGLKRKLDGVMAQGKVLRDRLAAGQRKIETAQMAIAELAETLEKRNADLNESLKECEGLRAKFLEFADGAIEGLSDMDSQSAPRMLKANVHLEKLTQRNRRLAKELFRAEEAYHKLEDISAFHIKELCAEKAAAEHEKSTIEAEKKLWMDIAHERESHVSNLQAEVDEQKARRVDTEMLRRRVVELDAKLEESEKMRLKFKRAAEELQKTTFQLRAERDGYVPEVSGSWVAMG